MKTNGRMKRIPARVLLLLAGWWLAGTSLAQTTVEYIHTDALGSVVAVTNAAGQVIERNDYEPYGAIIGKPSYGGVGFTGHVQDAVTGLTYMQQRYYDPQVGVFLSADPMTAYSSPVGQFHRYRYANNNPYRFKDPDGRMTMSDFERQKPSCQSDAHCQFGFQNGRSNADGKSTHSKKESPITTLDAVKVTAQAGSPNPYKLMAAGLRAANSGRLMASGLAKFGVGATASATGIGAAPGGVAMVSGTWNLMSSYSNFKSAGQLIRESYYTDTTGYTGHQKFRTAVMGGIYPFGTLSDDPDEPMYGDAVLGHARTMWNENPIGFISEVGTVAP